MSFYFLDHAGTPVVVLAPVPGSMNLEKAAKHFKLPPANLKRSWMRQFGDVVAATEEASDASDAPTPPQAAKADAATSIADEAWLRMVKDEPILHHVRAFWTDLAPHPTLCVEYVRACRVRQVDPLSRVLIPRPRLVTEDGEGKECVNRWELALIGTQDYFRAAAQRTGERTGEVPPQFSLDPIDWRDGWADEDNRPTYVRAGVMRKGCPEPFFAVLNVEEIVRIVGSLRGKRTDGDSPYDIQCTRMLGKCATVAAYRAAFPELCGGVYLSEEISDRVNRRGRRAFGRPSTDSDEYAELQALADQVDVPQNEKALHAKLFAAGFRAESLRKEIIDATRTVAPTLEEASYEAFCQRVFEVARQRFGHRGHAA